MSGPRRRRGGAIIDIRAAAPTMILSLVYDHRGVDGYPASLFLAAVGDRLRRAQEM